MKNKHTVGTSSKSNIKIAQTGETYTSNTYIHNRSLAWLATGTSTKHKSFVSSDADMMYEHILPKWNIVPRMVLFDRSGQSCPVHVPVKVADHANYH